MMIKQIVFTESFENMTNDQVNNLSFRDDRNTVIDRVLSLIEKFKERITESISNLPTCYELSKLGINNVLQFELDGFRLLFECEESTGTATAIALIRDEQDLQVALVDYCINHKS